MILSPEGSKQDQCLPKDVHFKVSETCDRLLTWQKGLTRIKFMDLKIGDYHTLYNLAQCSHMSP